MIETPALISFSGSRTSAYMLWRLLGEHDGLLPDKAYVVFANTGKEREETLRFVAECEDRWRVDVRWVEWRRDGFEEVNFDTASRNGEPFADLIAMKKMPPNWQARFCTAFLKVKPMHAFMAARGYEKFTEVIGLRADEGWRYAKMMGRNVDESRQCIAPLYKAGVTERDVLGFWKQQPFDLGLTPGEGNCDLCHLKGRGLRKALIRANPQSAEWWIEQERLTGGFFDRRDSYADLAAEVHAQPDFLAVAQDEHDVECGLLCGEPTNA